jgi:hypothetical protein
MPVGCVREGAEDVSTIVAKTIKETSLACGQPQCAQQEKVEIVKGRGNGICENINNTRIIKPAAIAKAVWQPLLKY